VTVRAGVYVRISRDLTGEGRGVARQDEDGRDLAGRLGWEVVEVYVDNDVSATSTRKARPEYRRMLDDLRADRLDAIIAWHPDRLYRRATDLAELVELVQSHDVKVATVKAGDVDLASPTGLLVAELLAAIAMYETRHKTERWERSVRQGREEGRPARTGTRLFGYDRDMNVIEAEAALARRMAEDVASGRTIKFVTEWLEAEGILATRGSAWSAGTVRVYLTNPKLAGYSTLGGEIVGEGQWTPILDRELWETIRALIAARARGRSPRVALLGGFLFCGRCGHRLITSGYCRKKGRDRTYRCPNRPAQRGCGTVSGLAVPVEQVVEAYARRRLTESPAVRERVAALNTVTGSGAILAEVDQLEQRVRELDAELDKPGVPVARLTRALDRAQARIDECQAALADALMAEHAVKAHESYTGGHPWPDDLATRRLLVAAALGRDRVFLDPFRPGWWNPNGFDVKRVRIGKQQTARPEHARALVAGSASDRTL